MQDYRIVLGLEINENVLRAAEIEHREDCFFLSRAADLRLASLDAEELVHKISYLINEEGILSRTVSVAIDSVLTRRDIVGVDSDLNDGEIAEFLKAEIDFHNDFLGEQFLPAFEVLSTSPEGDKDVFYAAIESRLLSNLKDSCTRCGLDLQFIDLDHSCSELVVNKLQPQTNNYILITVKDHQVEGSFCKGFDRSAYKYMPYSEEPFYSVTKIGQTLESIAKDYVDKIYITGTKADAFLLDMLQKNVDDRYELLNPTRKLVMSPFASANNSLDAFPQKYSAVIGAALK